jgi:hypothetical protein
MYQTAAIRRVRSDESHPSADSNSTRQPVQTETTVTIVGGVALVSVTLDNDTAAALRVRVENDIDGPALPPRQDGVPVAGWDSDRFTGVVPADGRLGVGYACPVAETNAAAVRTDDGPVSVEILGPADEGTSDPKPPDPVAATVRSLGRAAPPVDAIPEKIETAVSEPRAGRSTQSEPDATSARTPQPALGWLDAVERQIELAERLTDASADEAAAAIEDCGGIDNAATLPAELDGHLDALHSIGERIDDLASRAAAAEPDPVVSSLVAATNGEEPADRDTTPEPEASPPHRSGAEVAAPHGRTR